MLVMKPQKADKVKATLNCTNLNESLLKRISFKLKVSNFIRKWSNGFNTFNVVMFYCNNGDSISFFPKIRLLSNFSQSPKRYRLSKDIYSIAFSIKREDVTDLELLKKLIDKCLTTRANELNRLSLLTFEEFSEINNRQNHLSQLVLNALMMGFVKESDFDKSWLNKKEFLGWLAVTKV